MAGLYQLKGVMILAARKKTTKKSFDKKASEEAITKTEEKSKDIKKKVKQVDGAEVMKTSETVVVFKASEPLKPSEHKELSKRVKMENKATGVKIVLAPYSIDGAEIKEV